LKAQNRQQRRQRYEISDRPERRVTIVLSSAEQSAKRILPDFASFSFFITPPLRNRITAETDFASVIKNLREFFIPIIETEAKNLEFLKHWNISLE